MPAILSRYPGASMSASRLQYPISGWYHSYQPFVSPTILPESLDTMGCTASESRGLPQHRRPRSDSFRHSITAAGLSLRLSAALTACANGELFGPAPPMCAHILEPRGESRTRWKHLQVLSVSGLADGPCETLVRPWPVGRARVSM